MKSKHDATAAESVGHLCFARRGASVEFGVRVFEQVSAADAAAEPAGASEFAVTDRGTELVRYDGVGEPPDAATGTRRGGMVVVTGAWHVSQACAKLGVRVPPSVSAALRRLEEGGRGSPDGAPAVSGASEARSPNMKGKSGLSINACWGKLFLENEQRVKDGKKPLTDEQLIEKMGEEFPESAKKSTCNRPRMYRACWNKGTHFYAKANARKQNEPTSHQYDENGAVIEPGRRKAAEPESGGKKSKDTITMAEHDKARRAGKKGGKKGGKRVVRKGASKK